MPRIGRPGASPAPAPGSLAPARAAGIAAPSSDRSGDRNAPPRRRGSRPAPCTEAPASTMRPRTGPVRPCARMRPTFPSAFSPAPTLTARHRQNDTARPGLCNHPWRPGGAQAPPALCRRSHRPQTAAQPRAVRPLITRRPGCRRWRARRGAARSKRDQNYPARPRGARPPPGIAGRSRGGSAQRRLGPEAAQPGRGSAQRRRSPEEAQPGRGSARTRRSPEAAQPGRGAAQKRLSPETPPPPR